MLLEYDAASGQWRDELRRDWSNALRFDLPDLDVFAVDAATLEVNPASGVVYVSNTEARNEVRFEGPGRFGGSTVQGHLAEARITVIDGGAVLPRHLNPHLDYSRRPAPASARALSLATPLGMEVSDDGSTLYVAAFGSGKVGVLPTAALERGDLDPRELASGYLPVTGGGPSGLALDGRRQRLYVATRFDDGVSLVNLRTGKEIDHARLHNPEPINGTGDTRDFHPMKGPMTTQTLRGLAHSGAMHWRGRTTECDLTVKGTVNGEARGGLYDPAAGAFLTDREDDAPGPDPRGAPRRVPPGGRARPLLGPDACARRVVPLPGGASSGGARVAQGDRGDRLERSGRASAPGSPQGDGDATKRQMTRPCGTGSARMGIWRKSRRDHR